MIELENTVDTIIRAVKSSPDFDGVRFVKGYKNRKSEKPVAGFLAVVNIENLKRDRTFFNNKHILSDNVCTMTALLRVRLMCGITRSGEGLTRFGMKLCAEIGKADSQGFVTEIGMSPVGFDADTEAVYRDVLAEMKFAVSEVEQCE